MRVLLLHVDYIEFEAKKKAIKSPEPIEVKEQRLEDCIVCFMSVESADEKDPDYVVAELVKIIDTMAAQVKVERVAVYPYAHLSSDLGSLSSAQSILDATYAKVAERYEAIKAPFGWYKSFSLRCKGHPLA